VLHTKRNAGAFTGGASGAQAASAEVEGRFRSLPGCRPPAGKPDRDGAAAGRFRV